MTKCVARRGGMWLKVVISVIISCGATVWTSGNSPCLRADTHRQTAAEDTQPNPTSLESGLKTQDSGLKTPSPDIFFPETKHAFGSVFVGEKAEQVFKFVNRGDAVLDIIEITAGCECTIAKLKKWHIAPGEEEEIKVTFSPGENLRRGRTVKFVYVNSNDPDSPRVKLRFTANVRKDVVYTPGKLELGFVPKGNTGTKRILFESKLNPTDFKITKVTSFSPLVAVSYGKLNDKEQWYVDTSIKEDAVLGKHRGSITVFTNSVKQPEIKISTSAEVVQEITAVPARVCFGKIVKGKEAVRSLTILHAKDIKIEKVEPSLSWISANITPADNTNDTSVEVELKLSSINAPKGKSEGALSIYTNSQKIPVLKIHLCANVLES
ncbi:MAG TPA: DUF1573 domain-containing protein [Candidatus Brocadiales bacterium]|nr:DUF1573 domain-containing protein [Candidatus Brocadiales bacterium]